MSEPMVSPKAATDQLRKADQRWAEVISAFGDYPTRLGDLADAPDLRSRALTLASREHHQQAATRRSAPEDAGVRAELRLRPTWP